MPWSPACPGRSRPKTCVRYSSNLVSACSPAKTHNGSALEFALPGTLFFYPEQLLREGTRAQACAPSLWLLKALCAKFLDIPQACFRQGHLTTGHHIASVSELSCFGFSAFEYTFASLSQSPPREATLGRWVGRQRKGVCFADLVEEENCADYLPGQLQKQTHSSLQIINSPESTQPLKNKGIFFLLEG